MPSDLRQSILSRLIDLTLWQTFPLASSTSAQTRGQSHAYPFPQSISPVTFQSIIGRYGFLGNATKFVPGPIPGGSYYTQLPTTYSSGIVPITPLRTLQVNLQVGTAKNRLK